MFEKPEYRQLVVEFFCVLAEIFKRNPELEFPGQICVDSLIAEAIVMFKKVERRDLDLILILFINCGDAIISFLFPPRCNALRIDKNVIKEDIVPFVSGSKCSL